MSALRPAAAVADGELLDDLVARALTGPVGTPRSRTLSYTQRTLAGGSTFTFGLRDWESTSMEEALDYVTSVTGDDVAAGDPDAGYIAPEATLHGIERHANALREPLSAGGFNVLLATGHPTGLLQHYADLAAALRATGNRIVHALDDHRLEPGQAPHAKPGSGIRYVCDVACAFEDEAILHTHLPDYMTAVLRDLERRGEHLDLVIADHGMAGAAIEAGIPTMSIADVNDTALLLAHCRGRHEYLLCIEDNLAPAQFLPVTRAILDRALAFDR